ncbi:uncharacterized protein [Lepisosteus oculatus]|uniref:uncharacterized protein n=1 Tax=Lepisosteus oculatus TaxID=7918 RepID=UPI0037145175
MAGLRELETDASDLPPWLMLLLDESTSHETIPQKQKNKTDILQRVKTEFLEVKNSTNNLIETGIIEKRKNREVRIKTLLNALMASKNKTSLSLLLLQLKHELREPKSCSVFWLAMLKKEATELVGETDQRLSATLEKLSQFHTFSSQAVPYSKEKMCLLTLSLPSDKLLRPAVQDALLFLTENVIQLLPRHLKHWYQYRKLPFSSYS